MSGPHIAFLVPELGSGGAERAVANLATELARKGMRITVLTLRPGGAYEAGLDPSVHLVDLGEGKARRVVGALGRVIAERRIDIIVSVLFHLDFYTLLSRRLQGWRARVVVCFQNTPSVVARESASLSEKALLALHRLSRLRADDHIAISTGVAQDAARYFNLDAERIVVIPNPVVDPAAPPPVPVDLRALFQTRPAKVAVASGRLTRQKDYPTLLAALQVARRREDAALVVLGEGELRAELEGLAQSLGLADHVRFVGFQKAPLDWMAGADLFVLSSRWEGLANVLVEALHLGLPIVATDCPHGPSEVLNAGALGRLVPVGDAEAFGEAMAAALRSPTDRSALARRADDFSIPAIAERYLTCLG